MPVTCPFCPLRCDDLTVRVEGVQVVPQELDCPLADEGFAEVSRAVERGAANPSIDPLVDQIAGSPAVVVSGTIADIATARAAVRLAAAIGGVVDALESESSHALRRASEREGMVGATLAEIPQRADSVVMLGDPVAECPRLIERFLAPGPNDLAPRRRFLSLGETRIAGLPAERYTHLPVAQGDTHRVLAEARGGLRVGRRDTSGLADWLRDAGYVAWLWSSEVLDRLACGVLVGLIAELNRERRAVAVSLSSDTTLRSVASWLSGLSGPVDYGSGTPRLLERTAAAPVTIWLQPYPTAPPPPLQDTFLAVIGLADAELASRADLYLPAGAPGIDFAGSTFRGDGTVCLPLHQSRECGLTSPASLLAEIAARVAGEPTLAGDVLGRMPEC